MNLTKEQIEEHRSYLEDRAVMLETHLQRPYLLKICNDLCDMAEAYLAVCEKDHELNAADELCKAEREIERLQQEYVCRCGLRVTPHRCPTTSEF